MGQERGKQRMTIGRAGLTSVCLHSARVSREDLNHLKISCALDSAASSCSEEPVEEKDLSSSTPRRYETSWAATARAVSPAPGEGRNAAKTRASYAVIAQNLQQISQQSFAMSLPAGCKGVR